ncbi:hypothetical protein [Nocardia abscessus]|uniref:hypothetical protein n=1 Tax=Nocardia abscessus TaxID=120957 RepID=UPI002453D2B8|nr:hypothetical protein [Nocardia abscessus]
MTASVARAVTVLEQLQPRGEDILFAGLPHPPGGKSARRGHPGRTPPTLATIRQMNDFRDWINHLLHQPW